MARSFPRSSLRTVALLGRETGLSVLESALLNNDAVDLAGVITLGNLPKSEGGGRRPELAAYERLCDNNHIPLTVLNFPEALNVEQYLPENLDLMVVLSWRFIIRPAALERLAVGGINLHRGALPSYAGAEPVRRAIEAGEARTAITAHWLAEEIDMGPELARVWLDLPMAGTSSGSSAEQAERVKKSLFSLYAPLARLAIEAVKAGQPAGKINP